MHKPERFELVVLEKFVLNPTVKLIRFKTPEGWTFEAGQYVCLTIPTAEGTLRRSYSIASSPLHEGYLEICVKRIDHGRGSVFLHDLQPGTKVGVLGPLGHFIVNEDARNKDLVFIATGSGISPYRSLVPTLLKEGYKHKITLLTGARHEDEALFSAEFEELARKYKNFHYHSTISQPKDPGFSGHTGRVQALIDLFVPGDFDGTFYLCGLWPMIEETAKKLSAMGVPKERIKYERYS